MNTRTLEKAIVQGIRRVIFRLTDEGLTYSDVLLTMKWYKVMPR